MELQDKIIAFSFIMPVLLILGLVWFFLSYQKKKFQYINEKKDALLREQALKLQNQAAIEHERNRIASEMHDELGSGLTIIKYLSDGIAAKSSDITIKEDVNKIANYSSGLVQNMSEIIWAMNSRFDNLEGLIGYLRRYVVEYLEDNNMEFSYKVHDLEPSIEISGEKRRNVYLVVKELLHNSIKYAKASSISIQISALKELKISIIEHNAVGFDPLQKINEGNGIYNINKRLDQVGGVIQYERVNTDMEIKISVPITSEIASTHK